MRSHLVLAFLWLFLGLILGMSCLRFRALSASPGDFWRSVFLRENHEVAIRKDLVYFVDVERHRMKLRATSAEEVNLSARSMVKYYVGELIQRIEREKKDFGKASGRWFTELELLTGAKYGEDLDGWRQWSRREWDKFEGNPLNLVNFLEYRTSSQLSNRPIPNRTPGREVDRLIAEARFSKLVLSAYLLVTVLGFVAAALIFHRSANPTKPYEQLIPLVLH